jgi:chromosomal replication initiator protein
MGAGIAGSAGPFAAAGRRRDRDRGAGLRDAPGNAAPAAGDRQIEDATLDIGETILAHVAQNITSSGRELEGAFNQLLFRRSFEPNLTLERVDELLGHLVNAGEPKRVRIEDIQRVVSRHYNVSRQELVSDRRTRVIVKPRQIAMYLAKTMTPRSFPEIGRRFGGRDHTTVLHAVRKIEELINSDTKLGHEIELLKRLIIE